MTEPAIDQGGVFAVSVARVDGTATVVQQLHSSMQLIMLKKMVAKQMDVPWYEVVLSLGSEALTCSDGKRLGDLGIDAQASLLCVRQPAILEGRGFIQLDPPTEYVPPVTKFETHYNGRRPFQVEVHKGLGTGGGFVEVLGQEEGHRMHTFQPTGVFIGRWLLNSYLGEHWGDGTTILLQMPCGLEENRYIFIGMEVYSFETPISDPILHLFCDCSRNDVPYPVALSSDRVMFMMDKKSVLRDVGPAEPAVVEEWEKAYQWFYATQRKQPDLLEDFLSVAKIDKEFLMPHERYRP